MALAVLVAAGFVAFPLYLIFGQLHLLNGHAQRLMVAAQECVIVAGRGVKASEQIAAVVCSPETVVVVAPLAGVNLNATKH